MCIRDSPSPAVAAAAAARYTGEKPIINSITLEKGRYEDMLSAAQKYNTGLVALCMDDTGVPDGVERRIELANTLVEKLTAEGIAREDIYLSLIHISRTALATSPRRRAFPPAMTMPISSARCSKWERSRLGVPSVASTQPECAPPK